MMSDGEVERKAMVEMYLYTEHCNTVKPDFSGLN